MPLSLCCSAKITRSTRAVALVAQAHNYALSYWGLLKAGWRTKTPVEIRLTTTKANP